MKLALALAAVTLAAYLAKSAWWAVAAALVPPDEASDEIPPPRTRGLRTDGRPLDDYERRILGRVYMDALIGVPEPRYGNQEAP